MFEASHPGQTESRHKASEQAFPCQPQQSCVFPVRAGRNSLLMKPFSVEFSCRPLWRGVGSVCCMDDRKDVWVTESDRERQMPSDSTYIWNLKHGTNQSSHRGTGEMNPMRTIRLHVQSLPPQLPWAVVYFADMAQFGHCCVCGIGQQLWLWLGPWPRNLHMPQVGP